MKIRASALEYQRMENFNKVSTTFCELFFTSISGFVLFVRKFGSNVYIRISNHPLFGITMSSEKKTSIFHKANCFVYRWTFNVITCKLIAVIEWRRKKKVFIMTV